MSVQGTLPTEQQLHQNTVDVIVTVNGGRDTAHSILRGGGLVGMDSAGSRPPDHVPVEFVDWPFIHLQNEDITWNEAYKNHVDVVRRERPRYAVAPDADGSVSFGRVLLAAAELEKYADTVIIVPKTTHPSDVPGEYRVGMPCQKRFGKPPWPWTEYQDCDSVHLLGGSPSKHHDIRKYFVPVQSVDTATVVRAASFGSVWSEEKWLQRNDGFYTALEASVHNVGSSWNGTMCESWTKKKYVQPTDTYSTCGYPDPTLISPHDDMPFPGRRWTIDN